MSLQELAHICHPPASPLDATRDHRLDEIVQRYGLGLPSEYVAFGQTYGTGAFVGEDTHEIFIHNPFSRHFFNEIEECRIAMEWFFTLETITSQLAMNDIDEESLFPLGTDTGDTVLFWVTKGQPETWTILLTHTGRELCEFFSCGLCSFLVGYFTRQLSVKGWERSTAIRSTQRYYFSRPD